jgi:hypothetical protein
MVKVAGVFILECAMFSFCTLSPIGSTIHTSLVEVHFFQGPEARFKRGKEACFFKIVEENNDRSTVNQINVWELTVPVPRSGSQANPFNPGAEVTDVREVRVIGPNIITVVGNNTREGGVGKP